MAKVAEHPELWAEYVATRSLAVRARIAELHVGLVKDIAGLIIARLPNVVELDDLVQAGFVGLLKAIERFDPSRNLKFATYAQFPVRGACLDYLRSIDPASRLMRDRTNVMAEVTTTLHTELGRPPDAEEVRKRLDVDPAEFQLMLRNHVPRTVPLYLTDTEGHEQLTQSDCMIDRNEPAPGERLEHEDAFDRIIRLVLTDYTLTDALLLKMNYVEGMTLGAIAKHLTNQTESSISQRRKVLFSKLRTRKCIRELNALRGAA